METFYKVLAVGSPFIAAFLAALLTYYFTLRTKRFDILYQNKVPAFKDVTAKLIDFKKFCIGRMAFLKGNEFSPYYEENVGSLHHRTEIAHIVDANAIFFSREVRDTLENLTAQLSGLSNAELVIVSGGDLPGIDKEYERLIILTEECINRLYNDLNL